MYMYIKILNNLLNLFRLFLFSEGDIRIWPCKDVMCCSTRLVLLLVASSAISSQVALPAKDSKVGEDDEGHFIDEFIVEVRGDNDVADLVAGTHGFRMLSHVSFKMTEWAWH